MKLHYLSFVFVFVSTNVLQYVVGISILNNDDYESWSSELEGKTYELVNQPRDGATTVTIQALNEEDNVVSEFSLRLDGNALTWWANQVDAMYDDSDELLKDLTTFVTQTSTASSITTTIPINSLDIEKSLSINSTVEGPIEKRAYSNCGFYCGLSIQCSGILNPYKKCQGFGKRWLKHCVAAWAR